MLAGATISAHLRVLGIPLRLVSFSLSKLEPATSPAAFHSAFKIPQSSLSCFSSSSSTTAAAGSSRLNLTSPRPMAPSSKAKIVAEYAKSGRSSCKKCSRSIPAKSFRLGLVSRDSGGFDQTKWHHVHCFSETLDSVELIAGFNSLQDALKKLVDECKSSVEKVSSGATECQKGSKKGRKSPEAGEDGVEDAGDNKVSKKIKPRAYEEARVDIVFSISDVMDTYKGATLLSKWKALQTVIFLETDDGLRDSDKIAAFDFDGCLAKTSVKRYLVLNVSFYIPDKLSSLYNDGYKLVIFTNESTIDRWKNKRQVAVDSKIGRLNNFIQHVKVPIQVFIACGFAVGGVEDPYRKPNPGMWHLMEKHFNSGITVDMEKSFYVGDAAGRNDDHSDADIKFAQAVGLKFHVPEDFFGA